MTEEKLIEFLRKCVSDGASDVFFQVGSPPCAKVNGNVLPVDQHVLTEKDLASLVDIMFAVSGKNGESRRTDVLDEVGDDDFSFVAPGVARFRVNVFHQRGALGIVLRTVSFRIPDYQDIHIPEAVMGLMHQQTGMIIVCGPTGSGKSTTLACMIDSVNHSKAAHIVTIEDPIEYYHENDKCLITQREVGIDAKSFDSALRASLRQAPDIILLGEMRDYETIRTAITAAETGHLVLATLHTSDAISTVDRIVDIFPANQQPQIRTQLASVLKAVVAQRLVQTVRGDVMPVFEIMISNLAIRTLIRENQTHQITSILSSNRDTEMVSMDESLMRLYQDGIIADETVLNTCTNYELMSRKLKETPRPQGERRKFDNRGFRR